MTKPKAAVDFEKIIHEGRERKRNEDLAARIFSKNNQRKTAAAASKFGQGGSLASRVGVKKRTSGARVSAGNVNGEWTHDLHNEGGRAQKPDPNSLAARVNKPGKALPKETRTPQNRRQVRKLQQMADALTRTSALPTAQQQINVHNSQDINGFTIKGLAGPFAVLAQNFAPGTTAADIESALTPIGGLIISCRLLKNHPIVIAEIVFESREGAERVIQRFDQQTADGRVLSVFMKPGGYTPPPRAITTTPIEVYTVTDWFRRAATMAVMWVIALTAANGKDGRTKPNAIVATELPPSEPRAIRAQQGPGIAD